MKIVDNLISRIQHIDGRSIFHISLNFVNFFTYFLILFVSLMIYEAIFDRGNQYFLSLPTFTTPITVQSLSTQSIFQLFLVGDLARILLFIGLFIGYCYFFHYLNTSGANLLNNTSAEHQKMGIAFFYLFIICLVLTLAIPFGILSRYFGPLTPTNIIEITFLWSLCITVFFIMIGAAVLIAKIRNLHHPNLSEDFEKHR